MNLKTMMQERYACKEFSGETIADNKITELKEMIRLTPTSFGMQAFKVKIISDAATKEKLQTASFGQKQIGTASHVLIFCRNEQVEKRLEQYKELLETSDSITKEKAEFIVKYISKSLLSRPQEELNQWGDHQAFMALTFGLLAAQSLGIDSCPIGGFVAKEYSEILNLPAHIVPTVVMPIGIAADTPRPKQRFDDLFF